MLGLFKNLPWIFLGLICPLLLLAEEQKIPEPVRATFSNNDIYPCMNIHERLGAFKSPNCEGVGRRAGEEYKLKTNKFGLRDKDYPKQKTPGVTRILFVGPSQIFAPGLNEEDTVPRIVERLLNSEYGKKVEIINLGAERAFAVRDYLMLKIFGQEYDPDVIVHVLSSSGLIDDYKDHYFGKFENGDIYSTLNPHLNAKNMPSWTNSFARMEPHKIVNSLDEGRRLLHLGIHMRLAGSEQGAMEVLLSASLHYSKKIVEWTKTNKAQFYGYYIPGASSKRYLYIPNLNPQIYDFFMWFVPNYFIPSRTIFAYVSALNMGYESLSERLMGNNIYFLPNDWHFSVLGADVVAREIAADLARKLK